MFVALEVFGLNVIRLQSPAPEVLLGMYNMVETGVSPTDAIVSRQVNAYLDHYVSLAKHDLHHLQFVLDRDHASLMRHFIENPAQITSKSIHEVTDDPQLKGDLAAAGLFIEMGKYLLSKLNDVEKMPYLKMLIIQEAVNNCEKARIINTLSEPQKDELLSHLMLPEILEIFLRQVEFPAGGQIKRLTMLTDFFLRLDKTEMVLTYAPSVAQILVDIGTDVDKKIFAKGFPQIPMPERSANHYPSSSVVAPNIRHKTTNM